MLPRGGARQRDDVSSSTAPMTVNRRPPSRGCRATAASAAASGPLASTAPRPYRRSPARRTGISPGTVSRWPTSATTSSPRPQEATRLPAGRSRCRSRRPAAASREERAERALLTAHARDAQHLLEQLGRRRERPSRAQHRCVISRVTLRPPPRASPRATATT